MIDRHIPVMTQEVIELLEVKTGGKYIDATVGGGGHTEAILKKGGEVLGFDQDPRSLEIARKRLQSCPGVFKLIKQNFVNLQKIASENSYNPVDGVLFDLGFASFQMDNPERGLSINNPGPLDMRLDPELGVTAADLLNALPESHIYKLIKEVGEERRARAISRAIVARRAFGPFEKTSDLVKLIEQVSGRKTGNIHPATKTFMALRIAVNGELDNLKNALPQALEITKPGGRIVVISFHSGEDRIVKHLFADWERQGEVRLLSKGPIAPKKKEILVNPRARSAKVRAIKKI